MRSVEVGAFTVLLKRDGRPAPFNNPAAQGKKQGLNPGPFQAAVHGIGEDGFESLPVLAVHEYMISLLLADASTEAKCGKTLI
jgi:hypothetical protein